MRKNYKVPYHIRNFIKKELLNYKANKKLLKELEEKIIYESGTPDGMPRGNKLSFPTEEKAIKITSSREILLVKKRLLQIENALEKLDSEEKEIVDSIFFKGHSQIYCETHEYITKDVYYFIMNKMIYLTAIEYDLI